MLVAVPAILACVVALIDAYFVRRMIFMLLLRLFTAVASAAIAYVYLCGDCGSNLTGTVRWSLAALFILIVASVVSHWHRKG